MREGNNFYTGSSQNESTSKVFF